jgi:5-methylcytosine-specific restriction endonuclease McrA
MNSEELKKNTVLVLNRNWQAINITSPIEAISMMYSGVATGLDVLDEHTMIPRRWDDWCSSPHDESCDYIKTINNSIKIPKIIVLCNFDRVPKKRPKFTMKNIWVRDSGICQYSGKKLNSKTGNIDHIFPKSRGGITSWKNCVLSHKEINARKGNRTPEESGLKLIKPPSEPKELPVTLFIKNTYNIKEWNVFLYKS